MVLTVVLLNNDESFRCFLDPDLITIEETCEQYKLRTLSVEYWVEDFEKAKEDFKIGNKIWVGGDKNLTDCLYVINTTVERDYFKENNVVFELEEVLVELNYVSPFSQTDLKSDNGFNVLDNDGTILLDRSALGYMFGNYFNIGLIQECLHDNFKKIAPKGTINLMELLRFIEEETSNVFITRYEKDVRQNIIHRYLDFVNPNESDKNWELVIDYDFPKDIEDPSLTELSDESIQSEVTTDDDVEFEKESQIEVTPADDLKLRLTKNNTVLLDDDGNLLSFRANEIGLTGEHTEYEITIKYSTNNDGKQVLLISVLGESEDPDTGEIISSNPKETKTFVDLPKQLELQLYDTNKNSIIFKYGINAVMGKIHEDTLDLGYNTENITFEIDENDTYKAIAPLISNEEFSKKELDKVIDNWIKLSVGKGDNIPMIVQKISAPKSEGDKTKNSSLTNYWSKPIKQDTSNDTLDWWRGLGNWSAPFTKHADELFVVDESDTGAEYASILERKDITNKDVISTPKTGNIEISSEDVYDIYYNVCKELLNKRYPELNVEVDVANYLNDKANNYNLFDKVYVKIPTFNNLIIATVTKTVKNAHDIGTNKVELSNYSIQSKLVQLETEFDAENVRFNYPNSKNFELTLHDIDEKPLNGKVVSVAVLKVENQSTNYTGKVYNVKTNKNGKISIKLEKYDPGTYKLECQFGGDTLYEACSLTVDVTVGGTKIEYPTVSKGRKLVHKNIKWSKFGVSPKADFVITSNKNLLDNRKSSDNLIMAIGKAVSKEEKKKWGAGLIETIFERKCSRCGSKELYWGYKWAGKNDSGTFKPTKTVETGALTGRIICKKCGTSYNVLGVAGNKKLKVKKSTVHSKKTRLNKLKKGKLSFGTKYYTVSTKTGKNTGKVIARNFDCTYQSGKVAKKVKTKAKSIVDSKTGVSAVKELAKWIAKNIKTEDREGFYQTPAKTLQRKKGNSYCKTDLLLHMCDAVGVQEAGISCYYVYMHKEKKKSKKKVKKKTKEKTTKHMIARINGIWVDCCLKNPWSRYQTGFGAIKKADIRRYPCLPMAKKY